MKKRMICIYFLLIATLVLFASCGGETDNGGTNKQPHEHKYSEWAFVGEEPACEETGIQKRTCECGDEQTRDYNVAPFLRNNKINAWHNATHILKI